MTTGLPVDCLLYLIRFRDSETGDLLAPELFDDGLVDPAVMITPEEEIRTFTIFPTTDGSLLDLGKTVEYTVSLNSYPDVKITSTFVAQYNILAPCDN